MCDFSVFVEVAHPAPCRRRLGLRRRRPIRSSGRRRRPEHLERPVRLVVGPVAGDLDLEGPDRLVRVRRRSASCARRELVRGAARGLLELREPAVTAGAVTSLALMTTLRDEVSDGNASWTWLNVCTTGWSCGSEAEVFGVPMSIPIGRDRHAPRAGPWRGTADSSGRRRTPVHDPRPDAHAGHPVAETAQAGNPALLGAIAQHRQQGGEHRERSEHRDCDHHDRAGGERRERRALRRSTSRPWRS